MLLADSEDDRMVIDGSEEVVCNEMIHLIFCLFAALRENNDEMTIKMIAWMFKDAINNIVERLETNKENMENGEAES